MIVEVIRGLGMGGAETLLHNRLKYALSQRPIGFEETVVVNALGRQRYYTDMIRGLGIPVLEVGNEHPLHGMREIRSLLKRVDTNSKVLFHSPATSFLEKGRRALGKSDLRLIDVVHSTQYRPLYQSLGGVLDRHADIAIAVSRDVARASTTSHHRRVETVLAGVDVEMMRDWVRAHPSAPQELRRAAGVSPDHRLAVAVGSLIPLKGHRFIIRALQDQRLVDVTLVLVGDGAERQPLQSLALDLGVSDRVRFVGRVPDGWQWTAVADLIVHPSSFEGLPVALMEAAALGTPIVATDVGGIGQVLEHGGVGQLIQDAGTGQLPDAMFATLNSTSLISEVYPCRGSKASYWSVSRFASEFYRCLMSVDHEMA